MSNKPPAAIARPNEETDLQRFERELAEKHPGRTIVRFDFPSKIREGRAIYLMEVTSRDELEGAKYADAVMSDLEKKSVQLSTEAQRRETVRMSIVGLVTRTEPIAYRHIGGAVPFHEIDGWSSKAVTCVSVYFNNLNGINSEELAEGLKGQRTIGASVAPTNAIHPSASRGA